MYIVYSKPNCPFCDKAKNLLALKGLSYEERIIDVGQPKLEGKTYIQADDLRALVPSAKSVPQIFDDRGLHVGGFSDLERLLSCSQP